MHLTNRHIADFITALPGGNPAQYSRLLACSPNRINVFLRDYPEGKRLVKANLVKAPMKGRKPDWASERTERGVLTAETAVIRGDKLKKVLATIPAQYRPDAEHMLKMVIQMSSGKIAFNDAISEITAPYGHLALSYEGMQTELAQLHDMNAALRENNALLKEARMLDQQHTLRLSGPATADADTDTAAVA